MTPGPAGAPPAPAGDSPPPSAGPAGRRVPIPARLDPAWLLLGVVLVAVAFRLAVAAVFWQGTLGTVVAGVPVSDARNWHALATEFARGEREDPAWTFWSARRPLYYVFMGSIFALTGPSLAVTRAVHLGLGAAGAGLVFDLTRRLAPLPVALVVALFQALLLEDALVALTPMTEPLGDFLAIAALWSFVVATRGLGLDPVRPPRRLALAASGVCLGLANLARPLTLLAVAGLPAVAGALWLRRARRIPLRPALIALAVFLGAVSVTLAPWLVRQWRVHGIVTLSDDSAEVLFAATSPAYGQWVADVNPLAGTGSPGARFRFYGEATRRNLREHGGWYVRHVAGWIGAIAWELGPPAWPLWSALAGALLSAGGWASGARRLAAPAAVGGAILLCPAGWRAAFWLAGLGLACWRGAPIGLLVGMLGPMMLLMGLAATPAELRFLGQPQWLAAAFAVWLVWSAAGGRPVSPAPGAPGRWRRGQRLAAAAGLALLVLWTAGLVRAVSRQGRPPSLPAAAAAAAGDLVDTALAGGSAYEPLRPALQVRAARFRAGTTIHVPAGVGIRHWSPLVAARPFGYAVFQVGGLAGAVYVVFPGSVPPLPDGAPLRLVGIPGQRGLDGVFDAVALAPAAGRPTGDVVRADPAAAPAHARELLARLRR